MRSNHSETILLPCSPFSMEKLSSTKPVPGAKKVEDCHCRAFYNVRNSRLLGILLLQMNRVVLILLLETPLEKQAV